MSVIKTAFTGSDNETFDLGRILWAMGCLSFLAFEGYAVGKSGTFDMTGFGIGFSGLLMAGGGALLLKKSTEPTPDMKPDQQN